MGEFYENQLKLALSWKERSSLFSKWLMLTVLSDLFLFMGSFIKILLQLDVSTVLTHCYIITSIGYHEHSQCPHTPRISCHYAFWDNT